MSKGIKKLKGGIEIKIMALILLMAFAALGCIGLLTSRLTAVIDISDEIVSTQVVEEEKISELSREFTYINSQVLTHVMTTNAVTMQEMQTEIDKIMARIKAEADDMKEKMLGGFGGGQRTGECDGSREYPHHPFASERCSGAV